MQFGIMFANTGHGSSPEGARAVVQAAEAGGFTTAWTVEHVVVPSGYESAYPYDKSGKMAGGAEDFDLPDPLIWMAYAAAATTTLRLGTGILIVPQRNPVVTAKAVATLDHLSGGRIDLGVGVGWLREEFDALGVPFAKRGKRLDEYLDAMRALWTQDRAEFHGEFADFANCISRPKPTNGTVPIVVGGHTEAAARRAGTRGDAFFPGSATPEEISALVSVMKAAADEAGRDGDAIPVYAMCMGKPGDAMYARIEGLDAVGVSQTIVPTYSPDALSDIGAALTTRFA
jgi:probable F420-dependent oxidoreductase